jgi:hypothetical protein
MLIRNHRFCATAARIHIYTADGLEGDSMFMSSRLFGRRTRPTPRRTNDFRPQVESLDPRIVPANPHFVSASSSISADGVLSATFKEAGLGNNQNIDYTLTADVDATFGFVNNGGNVVQGEPWLVTGDTLASTTLSSDKNGNIEGTLTGVALTPNLAQPNGNNWRAVIDVSYTNVSVNDTTNGVSVQVADQSVNTTPPPKK